MPAAVIPILTLTNGRGLPTAATVDPAIPVRGRMLSNALGVLVPGGVSPPVPNPDAAVIALFAGGEQGFWYDPSDLSTMFQDAAGTTPVTAVGQPVGLIRDKSGRGNHASQTTTTKRPVLGQDANGFYYISFDGVDDSLTTPSMTVAQPATSFIGCLLAVTAGRQNNFFRSVSAGAVPYCNNGPFAMFAGTVLQRGTATSLNTPYVFSQVWGGGASKLRVNRDETAGNAGTNAIATAEALTIGSFQAGSFLSGRIYQMVVRAAASTQAQIDAVEAYMNNKTGAY